MEICSKLHSVLETLIKFRIPEFKYLTLKVNRVPVIGLGMSGVCNNDLFMMEREVALNFIENKLKMITLIQNSFSSRSPMYGAPIELKFTEMSGRVFTLMSGLHEYPNCCGAMVLSPMSLMGDLNYHYIKLNEIFPIFLQICYELVKIAGYSNVSYVLSQVENELFYEIASDLVKSDGYVTNNFINKKTGANCILITKNL